MGNYPIALDTYPSSATLASNNLSTDPHSSLHGNLGDGIEALQTWVGIVGSTDTANHTGQLAALQGISPTYFTPKLYTNSGGTYTEISYGTATALSGSPTLTAAISTTNGTSVSVSSGSALANGDCFQVDSEIFRVSSGGGTTSLTVVRGVAGTTAATHSNGAGLKNPMIKRAKRWTAGSWEHVRYMFRLGSSPTIGSAGDTWAFDLPSSMFGSIGNTADLIGVATIGHSYFAHMTCDIHLTATTTPTKAYFVPPDVPILATNSTGHTWGSPPGYGDAVASTDVITCPTAHNLSAGEQVYLSPASATWPGGVTQGTLYYVISSGLTSTAFKVSTTSGGSTINISSDGAVFVSKPPQIISVWNDFHMWVTYETT